MNVNIAVTPVLTDQISKHFTDRSTSAERCGVLLGYYQHGLYRITGFTEIVNSASNPEDTFQVLLSDVRHAGRLHGFTELDVIGSIHTHPADDDPEPSIRDVFDQPPNMLGCVVHGGTGRLTFYTDTDVVVLAVNPTKGKANV
jgi:proteasome lid subunit RPN8/RPN11